MEITSVEISNTEIGLPRKVQGTDITLIPREDPWFSIVLFDNGIYITNRYDKEPDKNIVRVSAIKRVKEYETR